MQQWKLHQLWKFDSLVYMNPLFGEKNVNLSLAKAFYSEAEIARRASFREYKAAGGKIEVKDKGTREERIEWSMNGKLHRINGPAREWPNGDQEWYQNGLIHRSDGPALVSEVGSWWQPRKSWWHPQTKDYRSKANPNTISPLRNRVFVEGSEIKKDLRTSDWTTMFRSTSSSGTKSEFWFFRGKPHRKGGPAFVRDHPSSFYEKWFQYGVLHRTDGPAITAKEPSTNKGNYQMWFESGLLHRADGPAIVEKNLRIEAETWYRYGLAHRENGPACTIRNGVRDIELWYRKGQRHREGGPAVLWTGHAGVETEEWYYGGNLHRTDGPAILGRLSGLGMHGRCYIHGKFLMPEEFRAR